MTEIVEEFWRQTNRYVRALAIATILIIVGYEALLENTNELDSLHHGLIFPAALAVRYGLFPNLDAFAQYGPLNPILQGNWLKIVGVRVFDMQLFTLFIATLLALLIYLIGRQYIGHLTAGLLALGWFMTGPQGLPWASLPANLIILTSAYILVVKPKISPTGKMTAARDSLAGLLLSLGIFARVQTALVALLVFIVLINLDRKRAFRFALGGIIGLTSFVTYLQVNNALVPFINECIVWASKTLGLAEVQPISISYIFELSWFLWTAVFLGSVIYLLGLVDNQRSSSKKSKRFVILGLTCVSVLFGVVSNLSTTNLRLNIKPLLLNPEYFLITASRKILFTLDFAPIMIFVALGLYLVISKYRANEHLRDSSKLALAFGFACLSQTFPISDSYHMWFLSPILISCIAILRAEFPTLGWQRNLNISLIILMIGLQVQTVIELNKDRYSFQNYTLSGMKSSLINAPQLDETMNRLDRVIKPGTTRFNCPDGIYSAANGRYNSVDSNFVNWGSKSGTNVESAEYVFICGATPRALERYLQESWSPVFKVQLGVAGESFNVLLRKGP
ncbi:hypothetical protein MCEMRE195_00040 [Candidatus Nanopelagicaceae bacterium]